MKECMSVRNRNILPDYFKSVCNQKSPKFLMSAVVVPQRLSMKVFSHKHVSHRKPVHHNGEVTQDLWVPFNMDTKSHASVVGATLAIRG
eukprot:1620365-Amphidinium_carterae.1